MNTFRSSNSLSVSVRLYRALLAAYPKKFREHYETQMVQVFRDSFRDAYHHNGMPGVIDLWLHTFTDLLVTALVERIMERSQYMFSPKVTMWGGLAGTFGGLFWLMAGLAPSSEGVAIVIALVLGLGGLAGLYSRQAGEGGKLGLAGLALGIIGTGTLLSNLWGTVASSNPAIDPVSFAPELLIISLGMLIIGVGLVLLGITSLRGKTPHRWRGLPLGVGLLSAICGMTFWLVYYVPLSQGRNPWDPWNPEAYLPNFAALVLLGVGWIGLGIVLTTEGDAQIPVAQPPPTSA